MKAVQILIVDDEKISAAPDLFSDDGTVKEAPSKEFAFQLHSLFRSGNPDEPIGVKRFQFGTTAPSELSFAQVERALDAAAESYSLIFLDLKLDQAGTMEGAFQDEVFAPIKTLAATPPHSANGLEDMLTDRAGLAFAVNIMYRSKWKGLLCIASGTNREEAELFVSSFVPFSSDRRWHALEGSMRSKVFQKNKEKFNNGLAKFCEIFGFDGVIRWWLAPPGGQPVWFPAGSLLHNPGAGDDSHYAAVAQRFGESKHWTVHGGQYSKRLFHITNEMLSSKRANLNCKCVPAELIRLVFGGAIELDGIEDPDLVKLPCLPALPFLWAAKHALDLAHVENSKANLKRHPAPPIFLKRIGDQFALALRPSRDATQLASIVNAGTDLKNVSGYIHNALRAKVKCPDGDQYRNNVCAPILNGFADPIAEVKWDKATKELRIAWPPTNPIK